jgi:hypothetical protein
MVVGEHRSFEWFWAASGEMPGLDDFESLDKRDQDAVIATFEYWSSIPVGKRAIETRINEEHHDPLILAGKAGKHRFTVFHAVGDIWVVHRRYEKRGRKLDKAGRIIVKTTIAARADYYERVGRGEYYGRD